MDSSTLKWKLANEDDVVTMWEAYLGSYKLFVTVVNYDNYMFTDTIEVQGLVLSQQLSDYIYRETVELPYEFPAKQAIEDMKLLVEEYVRAESEIDGWLVDD